MVALYFLRVWVMRPGKPMPGHSLASERHSCIMTKDTCDTVAPNVTVTLQTALLGNYGGSSMQAEFGAVATTATTICFLLNFLKRMASVPGQQFRGKRLGNAHRHVRLALIWYIQGSPCQCSLPGA